MKPLIGLTPDVEKSDKDFFQRDSRLSVNYSEAIKAAGGIPVILPLTTDRDTLRELLGRCDGLLLTGGGDVGAKQYDPKLPAKEKKLIRGVDDARDEMEIFLIWETLAAQKPVLGICRGIQTMNVAGGGTLVVDIPTWKLQKCEIATKMHKKHNTKLPMEFLEPPVLHRRKPKPAEHDIGIEPGSRLREILSASRFRVNSFHHQAVGRVARDFRVTARAPDGVIEAIEHSSHPFALGVQFHPERMFRNTPKILRLFAAFINAAQKSR